MKVPMFLSHVLQFSIVERSRNYFMDSQTMRRRRCNPPQMEGRLARERLANVACVKAAPNSQDPPPRWGHKGSDPPHLQKIS